MGQLWCTAFSRLLRCPCTGTVLNRTEPEFKSNFIGDKASYGMGFKTASISVIGLSMLHKIYSKTSLTPSLPILCTVYTPFPCWLIWKLSDRYKCAQTNRRDLPHSIPFSLKWGMIADYRVDYEIRWVIVNSGIGSHTPCFSSNTVSVQSKCKVISWE